MNIFQQLVQESLTRAGYYWFHPTDFNIAQSNAHVFTLRKDADYICGDVSSGKIFWVEVKETSDKKFHPLHSRSNARQFLRALEIDYEFRTYFYIIHFKNTGSEYCFRPSLIMDSKVFDPEEFPDLKITYLTLASQTVFGKTTTKNLLDLHFLTDLLEQDEES